MDGYHEQPSIENLVTSGTFSLDGGTWDVDNNVWIVGDDDECVVIDPPHNAAATSPGRGRKVLAILLTHAPQRPHPRGPRGRRRRGRPHPPAPGRPMLWKQVYPDSDPDRAIDDGDTFEVAGAALHGPPHPGPLPGLRVLHLESEGTVFTGDTLFNGGPGATGRSYSDFATIIDSIRDRLLRCLPKPWSTPATETPPRSELNGKRWLRFPVEQGLQAAGCR